MEASSSPPLARGNDDVNCKHEEDEAADLSTQRDLAAEAQFLAHFDPLAMLEAEYAAVLAQSRPSPSPDDSDDEDNACGGGDDRSAYAALPTSPTSSSGRGGDDDSSEFYQPLGDDSDGEGDGFAEEDDGEEEHAARDASAAEEKAAGAPALETATRSAIMQSMQRLALAPPPWAKDASLSDDDLIAMVQRRMQR